MGLININSPTISPDLPKATPAAQIIAARAALRSWWRVQDDKLTVGSGEVTNLDQLAGAAGLPLYPATSGQRPMLTPAYFSERYPAVSFDGDKDVMRTASLPYTKDGSFSWVAIGTMLSDTVDNHIAGLFSTSGLSTVLRLNGTTSNITFQHGSGTATVAAPSAGAFFGQPLLVIATSDTTTLKLMANGLMANPSPTNNAQSASVFCVGAANTSGLQGGPWQMAEMMIFQEDLLAAGAADFVDTLSLYARLAYGVGV